MPLPGHKAQLRMSPSHRAFVPPAGKEPPFVGAVMLLLYPGDKTDGLHVVLTVRTHNATVHKGQVSLPGGCVEPHDDCLAEAALREAGEELGIPTDRIEIIGRLTPIYIEPSNFHVHPFVAYLPSRPSFIIEQQEVTRVLEVPISHFFDPRNTYVENWMIDGNMRRIPYFDVCGKKVWGATAIIISEFMAVLETIDGGPDIPTQPDIPK